MAMCNRIGNLFELCRKTFEWKIDNFFSYTENYSRYASSNFFVSDSTWYLQICPNGEFSRKSLGCVALYLYRADEGSSKTIEFELGIKTVNGDIEYKHNTTWISNTLGWGFMKFIKVSELESQKSKLVPSGILTIICTISIKGSTPDIVPVETRMKKLAADFKDMFISEKHCDASIKIDEVIIPVHKNILAARSPVFAAMFENEMSEKQTGSVNICDCEPTAFKDFLLYLYAGHLDLSKSKLYDVYKIADKYDVPDLKAICKDLMIRNLCVENFCEYYVFSHQFNEIDLMTEVKRFFNRNLEAIFCSSNWISLLEEYSDLANDLLKNMVKEQKTTHENEVIVLN